MGAREAQADLANQMHEQLCAERKAERADKREERAAKVKAHFEEVKAKRAARKAATAEAREIAEAQFASSTKEMLGTE